MNSCFLFNRFLNFLNNKMFVLQSNDNGGKHVLINHICENILHKHKYIFVILFLDKFNILY